MELVYIKDPDFEVMMKIVEIEQETFEGNGNVDLWIIKALIRYGLVFVIKENDKIVCIVEYMQVFNKKSLFLYGISTLKEYRHKGYGNYILNETEKKRIEPSSCAAFEGVVSLLKYEDSKKYIENRIGKNINNVYHVCWATGGKMVPQEDMEIFLNTYLK